MVTITNLVANIIKCLQNVTKLREFWLPIITKAIEETSKKKASHGIITPVSNLSELKNISISIYCKMLSVFTDYLEK